MLSGHDVDFLSGQTRSHLNGFQNVDVKRAGMIELDVQQQLAGPGDF